MSNRSTCCGPTKKVFGFVGCVLCLALPLISAKSPTAFVPSQATQQQTRGLTSVAALIEAGDVAGLRKALESEPGLVKQESAVARWTLLHSLTAGASPNALEVCALLIEKGADVNAKDSEGNTPLHFAMYHSGPREKLPREAYEGIIRLLLDRKANPSAMNSVGVTPLHSAVVRGAEPFALELLITAGAQVNARSTDANGAWTPLHGAAAAGRIDLVKVLIEHGADIRAKDARGLTPYQAAQQSGQADVATLLAAAATGAAGTAVTVANPAAKTGRAVTGPVVFGSITAGYFHTCGVTAGNRAYCWGYNNTGNLGDGTTMEKHSPVAVSGDHLFTSLAVSWFDSCGLSAAGAAFCWGGNRYVLGDRIPPPVVPVDVPGGLKFTSISAGYAHTCGLTASGAAYCWGYNSVGQLGNGTKDPSPDPKAPGPPDRTVPVPVAGGLTFIKVEAGYFHTCGITSAGAAYCWGSNSDGQLGDGSVIGRTSPSPAAVAGRLTFTDITAGQSHTCARTSNGLAYCWGDNNSGQLGDGTVMDRTSPVAVTGLPKIGGLDAGAFHTCGWTNDGVAYCWGNNSSGQLGNGTFMGRNNPTPVIGGIQFSRLSAGGFLTCGWTRGGAGYCWGNNANGNLGDGSTVNRASPTPIRQPQ